MIVAYFNYPNAAVTLHGDPQCTHIGAQHKANQRKVRLTVDTLSSNLRQLEEYRFAANPEFNDMWISVDFADREFEQAVVAFWRRTLGKRYTRFANAEEYRCRCFASAAGES